MTRVEQLRDMNTKFQGGSSLHVYGITLTNKGFIDATQQRNKDNGFFQV